MIDRLVRAAGPLAVAALLATGVAQPAAGPLVVPPDVVAESSDGISLRTPAGRVGYLAGLGWTHGAVLPPPAVDDAGRLRLAPATAAGLGLPHLAGVRTGLNDATTRLVVDFGATEAAALEAARREAVVAPDRALELALPGVLVPDGALLARDGLRLDALPGRGADPPRLRLTAPAARATVFPLAGPTRLVIDLTPLPPGAEPTPGAPAGAPEPRDPGDAPAAPGAAAAPGASAAPGEAAGGASAAVEPTLRALAPGVRYRTLAADGREGVSRVHVVELAPGAVELRVVGRSGEGRPVAAWADGGIAAINAGYFDPDGFDAIGLRRIGGTLLSWPSRGRAAVGFGPDGTVIARAGADVRVRVDGRLAAEARLAGDGPWAWSQREGARVGSARTGVLVLAAGGRVVANRIGPQPVPAGGAALAYDPAVRALALVEPGQRVQVRAELTPPALQRARWAVEAGPLLVQDGRPAFDPEREGFARGRRILDEATQQAALGVRPDGTVLLVVAERMVAQDLVPLFLRLGARAAMRLDSGSSATLVADGRAVNRLLSRRVESAIVAVPAVSARDAR
jgi:hypothetical protein